MKRAAMACAIAARPFEHPGAESATDALSLLTEERPKDAALRRPSPAGIEESGEATFPQEAGLFPRTLDSSMELQGLAEHMRARRHEFLAGLEGGAVERQRRVADVA